MKRKAIKRKATLFVHRYKCRRVSGTRHMWRLLEFRSVNTKPKGWKNMTQNRYRWVCIAIGTKALNDVALKLNLLP